MITYRAVPAYGDPFCIQAEEGEEVVGYVLGLHFSDQLAYIWHLSIEPKWRRKGQGRKLIEKLMGLYPVVATQMTTDMSRKLFKKLGFKKEEKDIVWRRESGSI